MASAFVVVAAAAVPGSPWLIVAGLAGHGLKDLWQHRTRFVAGTRWWPPFCATVDRVAAGLIAAAILTGHIPSRPRNPAKSPVRARRSPRSISPTDRPPPQESP